MLVGPESHENISLNMHIKWLKWKLRIYNTPLKTTCLLKRGHFQRKVVLWRTCEKNHLPQKNRHKKSISSAEMFVSSINQSNGRYPTIFCPNDPFFLEPVKRPCQTRVVFKWLQPPPGDIKKQPQNLKQIWGENQRLIWDAPSPSNDMANEGS